MRKLPRLAHLARFIFKILEAIEKENNTVIVFLVLTMMPQPQQQQQIKGIPTMAFVGSTGGIDADEQ